MKYLQTTHLLCLVVTCGLATWGAHGARAAARGAASTPFKLTKQADNDTLEMWVGGKSRTVQSVLVNAGGDADHSIVLLFSDRSDACELLSQNKVAPNSSQVGVQLLKQINTGLYSDLTYAQPTAGGYAPLPNPPEGHVGLYQNSEAWNLDATCSLPNQGDVQQNREINLPGSVILTQLVPFKGAMGQVTLETPDGGVRLRGAFRAVNCAALSEKTYVKPSHLVGGPTCKL